MRDQLTVIETREQQYRVEVGDAIGVLEADVGVLLKSKACSTPMRQTLEDTLADLEHA